MTQKKKQLSLIRSVFLTPGLQSRNMILFLLPVTTPSCSKARETLWTSLSFSVTPSPSSHCNSSGVFHCQRLGLCLQLLPVKHVLCRAKTCCLLGIPPELALENTASTLVQRKQLPKRGHLGLTQQGLSSPSKVHGGPGAGGIQPPSMHIPPQASAMDT